jgi:hypothetical protein
MKNRLLISASWCVTAFILAGGGVSGWRNHQAIARERVELERLEAGASSGESPERGGRSRPSMQAREEIAKDFACRLIKHWNEFPPKKEQGDEAVKGRLDLFIEWDRLDSRQLKIVIAALRADVDLPEDERRTLVGLAINYLAHVDPSSVLEMAYSPEWRELIQGKLWGGGLVPSAIACLARKDLDGALTWLREHPEWNEKNMKRMLVEIVAKQDTKRALELAWDYGDDSLSFRLIDGKPQSEWLSLLTAMREKATGASAAKGGKFRDKLLGGIASQLSEAGPAAAKDWLDQAALNEAEALAFLGGISNAQDDEHAGEWIEWAAARLPAKKISSDVESIAWTWTKKDYKAVGEWLNQAAEGPVKLAVVKAYAEMVAFQDPEIAAQWAVTLPAGKDRDRVLKRVRDEWKKKDEAAAAEFARKNGM